MSVIRTLTLDSGRTISYTVDRGRRKYIYITVRDGRVVLKLPCSVDEAQGVEFLRKKADWVLAKLEPKKSEALQPDLYSEGTRFTLAGEEFTVACETSPRYFPPRFEEGRLVVAVSGSIADPDAYTDVQARKAIAARTLELIEESVNRLAALTGLYPAKVTVRKMTASWGRCSSKGSISINSNIVFYPKECIDYVVIHELCHLRYMDHSREFWELVGRYCPDWKELRRRLK